MKYKKNIGKGIWCIIIIMLFINGCQKMQQPQQDVQQQQQQETKQIEREQQQNQQQQSRTRYQVTVENSQQLMKAIEQSVENHLRQTKKK